MSAAERLQPALETAEPLFREFKHAVDGDFEIPDVPRRKFNVNVGVQVLNLVPRTEGMRLVVSSAAVSDLDFHGVRRLLVNAARGELSGGR